MGTPSILIADLSNSTKVFPEDLETQSSKMTLSTLYFPKIIYKVTAKWLLFLSSAIGAAPQVAPAASGQALPRPHPAAAMQFMLLFSGQEKLRLQRWGVP